MPVERIILDFSLPISSKYAQVNYFTRRNFENFFIKFLKILIEGMSKGDDKNLIFFFYNNYKFWENLKILSITF